MTENKKTAPLLSSSASPMPPVEVSLWHDRAAMLEALAERGIGVEPLDGFPAQTFDRHLPDGSAVSFVLLEAVDGTSLHGQVGMMAHEAVHAAFRYMERIGEREPGEEALAYAVQAAASIMAEQHIAWLADTGRWPAEPEVSDDLRGVLR